VDKGPEAFRTITEAADELDIPAHVLRFWEGKFSQLRPLKRAGGRRLYRPEDISLLRGIRDLIYADGQSIKAVQKLMREQGAGPVRARGRETLEGLAPAAPPRRGSSAARDLPAWDDLEEDVADAAGDDGTAAEGEAAADNDWDEDEADAAAFSEVPDESPPWEDAEPEAPPAPALASPPARDPIITQPADRTPAPAPTLAPPPARTGPSPAAGVVLRRALVRLEEARTILDRAVPPQS
jgi:DNA-binding transcriptional MerR regulator